MDEWNALSDINIGYWVAGGFAILEFFKWLYTLGEWFFGKFGIETKNMRSKREFNNRLKQAEKDIVEIKDTAKANVAMLLEQEKKIVNSFVEIKNEVVRQLDELSDKFDEQKEQLEEKLETIDNDGKKRDVAIMRDRLIQAVRYFSQNKDENGTVHINMTDYENINEMFQEYFRANGNGVIKHIYDTEFQLFKIDSAPFDLRK